METGDPLSKEYRYFVYAMPSEGAATLLCSSFRQAFELVYAKTIVDNL